MFLSYTTSIRDRVGLDAAQDYLICSAKGISPSHWKISFSCTEIKLNKRTGENSWKFIFVAQVDAETKLVPGQQK